MKRMSLFGMAAILVACGATAQQAPVASTASDQWAPAKSASMARPANTAPAARATEDHSAGHFKFKDSRPKPSENPWPHNQALDGSNKPGNTMDSSRPPLNCGQNPTDPACR
jgi:curli biogenesis system outer membrane secretion channel CsgG